MFPATDVVVGASDRDAMVDFFGVAGFTPRADGASEVRLCQGGVDRAGIVVRSEQGRALRREPYLAGPAAIDIYTSDLRHGTSMFEEAGYEVGRFADLSIGPVVLKQVRIHGPDHVPVVLVETSHRRSSLLDTEPGRLFSEGHSLVWVVADRDEEAAWWVERGATKGTDLDFEVSATTDLLDLPDPQVAISMTMLSDDSVNPFRLELLEFRGRTKTAGSQDQNLPGIQGLRFGNPRDPWDASPGGVRYQAS